MRSATLVSVLLETFNRGNDRLPFCPACSVELALVGPGIRGARRRGERPTPRAVV